MTGLGIFYPDYRETQRIGIIPHYETRPTINGLRQGKDEVLNFALNCELFGIREYKLNGGLIIYPNPSISEISITGVDGIIDEVRIYNELGQIVIHEMKPHNTIDVSRLPQGLYIVEVIWDGHRVREKLIVQ